MTFRAPIFLPSWFVCRQLLLTDRPSKNLLSAPSQSATSDIEEARRLAARQKR
jgi:hypothetical protein